MHRASFFSPAPILAMVHSSILYRYVLLFDYQLLAVDGYHIRHYLVKPFRKELFYGVRCSFTYVFPLLQHLLSKVYACSGILLIIALFTGYYPIHPHALFTGYYPIHFHHARRVNSTTTVIQEQLFKEWCTRWPCDAVIHVLPTHLPNSDGLVQWELHWLYPSGHISRHHLLVDINWQFIDIQRYLYSE